MKLTGRFFAVLPRERELAGASAPTPGYHASVSRRSSVVVDDSEGIGADLDANMQKSIDAYCDPWIDGRDPVTQANSGPRCP